MRIAFGCTARVGKDTAVEYLISEYGGYRLSFAQPIYYILTYAQKVCNFPVGKDRKFLQWVGTDWARSIDDSVWIKVLTSQLVSPTDNYYVSDLRFDNECRALRENGFTLVRIIRPGVVSCNAHSSENGISDNFEWDYTIYNSGTLEELYRKLDILITNLKQVKT